MELPRFEKPPVVEVALAAQFDPVRALRSPALARYWETIREDFPEWTEQSVKAPVKERFGAAPDASQKFRIELLDEPPPTRALFAATGEDRLVQVQPDRFVTNWKKAADPYPHYDSDVRDEFRRRFTEFRDFLAESELGECRPNQWEVTYVNLIRGDGWDPHRDVGRVLTTCAGAGTTPFLGEPEWTEYSAHYLIADDGGEPIGRLHVNAAPAVERDSGIPVLKFVLTARGYPAGPSTDDVMHGLDTGRRHVVRAFEELTTEEMHQLWEKE